MKVIVAMRDNYTRYRIKSRGMLGVLLTAEPANDKASIPVEIRRNPDTEWLPKKLRYINRNAIASVTECDEEE